MTENTDHALYVAMLTRANIRYKIEPSQDPPNVHREKQVPSGCVSVLTGQFRDDGPWERDQPYDGGYSGFYTETVFDSTGQLLAVWAWE